MMRRSEDTVGGSKDEVWECAGEYSICFEEVGAPFVSVVDGLGN